MLPRLCCALVLGWSCVVAAADDGNLVENPSFDSGTLEPWTPREHPDDTACDHVAIVNEATRTGEHALKVVGAPDCPVNSWMTVTQILPIDPDPDETYRVVAHFKTNVSYVRDPDDGPGPRSAGVRIRQVRNGNTVVYNRLDRVEKANLDERTRAWGGERREAVFIAHPDATAIQILLLTRNLRADDYIIYDDFHFEVLDEEDRYKAFE